MARGEATSRQTRWWVAVLAWVAAATGAAGLYATTIHFGRWERANAAPQPVPMVGRTRPLPGESDVLLNTAIAANVYLPNVGGGISSLTMNTRNVHLDKVLPDGRRVPVDGHVNTSGAGDSIVFQPSDMLDPGSTYRFSCSGVRDTTGAEFRPYAMTFTTAASAKLSQYPVAFDHVQMRNTWGHVFSGITMGPDGRLYAGSYEGVIYRYDLRPDGTVVDPPLAIQTLRRANVTADNFTGNRLVTGLCFDPRSTAADPILWVTNGVCAVEHCPDWSCKLSRLTGPNLDHYQDAVVGLPRAYRDHLSFKIAFDPHDPSHLYFNQGSSSSTGAADRTWGLYPEHLLTAACLQVDVPAIEKVMAAGRPLNVKTEGDDGHYNPWDAAAPLKIYATGIRSGFGLLFHSNGHLYSCINGGAEGGAAPATPDDLHDVPRRVDAPYRGGAVPGIDLVTETQHDLFIDIARGAYYGHPNETRGEYALFGGNPGGGVDDFQTCHDYPKGVQPDKNFHPATWDLGISYSCNGLIEYRGRAFGGYLDGKVLTTRFSSGKDVLILELTPDGRVGSAVSGVDGLTQFVDPLDLVENPATGNVYVTEWGGQKLTLLRPRPTSDDVSRRVFRAGGAIPPAAPAEAGTR